MDGSRSSDDKVFQAAGPDVENARGSNVDNTINNHNHRPHQKHSLNSVVNWISLSFSQSNLTEVGDAASQIVLHKYVLAFEVTMRNTRLAYNTIHIPTPLVNCSYNSTDIQTLPD